MKQRKFIWSFLFATVAICALTSSALAQRRRAEGPVKGDRVLYGDFQVEADSKANIPTTFQLLLYSGPNMIARQPISPGGRYRFNNLFVGEYFIAIELDGSEIGRIQVRIYENSSEDVRQDITFTINAPSANPSTTKTVAVASLYKRSDENQKKFQQAMEARKQKKYEEAQSLLQQITSNDPQDFVALTELGTTLFQLNKQNDAEANYQKALVAYPTFFPALLNLGRLRLGAKNFDGAIEVLTKAVEIDSKSAEGNHLLGEAYLQNKKGSKAVGYLNEAIKLDPMGKAEIHLRLAALYNAAGMKDRAAAEYEQFLIKKPDYPEKTKLEKYIAENKKS